MCYTCAMNKIIKTNDTTNNTVKSSKYEVLNSDIIKIIACVIMLIDHLDFGLLRTYLKQNSMVLAPDTFANLNSLYKGLDGLGRIAFPIFCFFLVEGFIHTGNKIKYAVRLFIFALVSELPFDLGLFRTIWYPDHQNVILSLFIAFICLMVIEKITEMIGITDRLRVLLIICAVAGFGELATLLHTDYSWKCIVVISVMYLLRTNKSLKLLAGAAFFSWEKFAPIAFLILYFYDSSKKPRLKYFFYLFYPTHLILIYLIGSLLGL